MNNGENAGNLGRSDSQQSLNRRLEIISEGSISSFNSDLDSSNSERKDEKKQPVKIPFSKLLTLRRESQKSNERSEEGATSEKNFASKQSRPQPLVLKVAPVKKYSAINLDNGFKNLLLKT
jgi:hypothetical protein